MAPAWVTLRAAHQPTCTALAQPIASSIARVMPMTHGARSASSTATPPAPHPLCAVRAAATCATPAAVKIAAANPVRSALVRRMWSLMGVGLSERRGSVEPAPAMSRIGGGCCPRLLRGDAGDPHHVDDALHFVFHGPSVPP